MLRLSCRLLFCLSFALPATALLAGCPADDDDDCATAEDCSAGPPCTPGVDPEPGCSPNDCIEGHNGCNGTVYDCVDSHVVESICDPPPAPDASLPDAGEPDAATTSF
jgi:hypothetical protein